MSSTGLVLGDTGFKIDDEPEPEPILITFIVAGCQTGISRSDSGSSKGILLEDVGAREGEKEVA